jgi:hypothetical protein
MHNPYSDRLQCLYSRFGQQLSEGENRHMKLSDHGLQSHTAPVKIHSRIFVIVFDNIQHLLPTTIHHRKIKNSWVQNLRYWRSQL